LDRTVEADDTTFHFTTDEGSIKRPWKFIFGETSPHKMIKVVSIVVDDGAGAYTEISDDTIANPYEIMAKSPANLAIMGTNSAANDNTNFVISDRFLTAAPILAGATTGTPSFAIVGSSNQTADVTLTTHNLISGDYIQFRSDAIIGPAGLRSTVVVKRVSATVLRVVCPNDQFDGTWLGGNLTVERTSTTVDVHWLGGNKWIPRSDLGVVLVNGPTDGSFTVPDATDWSYRVIGGSRFPPELQRLHNGGNNIDNADARMRQDRYYRLRFDTTGDSDIFSHAEILKRLLEAANLSVNSASFTTADSDLVSDVRFTIPEFDQATFGPYLDYAQRILSSAFGNLAINDSFEIVYKVFDTPSPTLTATEKKILENSLNYTVDYTDIVTQLVATNPYTSDDDSDTEVNVTYNTGKHLHEVDNVKEYRHVLTDMSTRATDIMKALRNRQTLYSFSTATHLIDSDIGDEVTIDSDQIESGESDIVITQVRRSGGKVDVKGTDLGDL
jgi:hypothetical protein